MLFELRVVCVLSARCLTVSTCRLNHYGLLTFNVTIHTKMSGVPRVCTRGASGEPTRSSPSVAYARGGISRTWCSVTYGGRVPLSASVSCAEWGQDGTCLLRSSEMLHGTCLA